VTQDNAELSTDDDAGEYYQTQRTQLETSMRDKLCPENANLHGVEEPSGMELLAQHLRGIGIDPM
jgi:hypothetical protein